MLLVGLTGGIGSGKSLVGRFLAGSGAVVVDADTLARDAIASGTPGRRQVLERFGAAIATPDGDIDRAALGRLVFDDDGARRDLEAIVHPEVRRLFGERVAALTDPDAIVVFEAPLLIETGMAAGFDVLLVVLAPEDVRLRRLAAERGLGPDEALARIRAQTDDATRRAAATIVIDNPSDDADALRARVAEVWEELVRRARG